MFDVALSSLALKWPNASLYLFLVKFVHSVFFSLFPKLITELKPLDEKLKSEEELLLTQSQIPEQNGSLEESMVPGVPTKKASKRPTKTATSASCLLDDEGKVLEEDSAVGKGLKVKVKVKDEKKASRKRQAEEDRGLMGPVEDNGAVKLAKGKKKEAEQAAERATEEQPLDEEKDETEEGKRAITNQVL
ncbi:PREDICTED: uncharacterized protein LOC107356912 isoform X3 [Acropora digitifera]|uniref:uncharacterized protein LOC107356912 isoform X3 n=1 Tax=Acropora digitifera TaxID=70779 RepID=UPI000779FF10|nr:PREDICTED: uncharacterized protein LOC107356912 isoform X3 [Acropora digitifera]